jgi:hypothetical protein
VSGPSSNCSTCTDWLGDVYSDSSAKVCLSGSACADGEESIYTYGYNVGTYTITYADGTVLDMSYDNDWNNENICVPEGDYTVCVDFGGDTYGWFEFGDMYFDACQINDTCTGSGENECVNSGGCEDGLDYYVYTYGGNCNGGDRTFTISDVNTGDVV